MKQLLIFVLCLASSTSAIAQTTHQPIFKVIVHLTDGSRVKGVLNEVKEGVLYLDQTERFYSTSGQQPAIALGNVEWVAVRRVSDRKAVRTGAILGGLLGGYLSYRGIQRNGYRHRFFGGVSIVLTAGALATAGAFVGSLVGGANRRVIRPMDRDNPVGSLERQLQPFTRTYLDGMKQDQPQP